MSEMQQAIRAAFDGESATSKNLTLRRAHDRICELEAGLAAAVAAEREAIAQFLEDDQGLFLVAHLVRTRGTT